MILKCTIENELKKIVDRDADRRHYHSIGSGRKWNEEQAQDIKLLIQMVRELADIAVPKLFVEMKP